MHFHVDKLIHLSFEALNQEILYYFYDMLSGVYVQKSNRQQRSFDWRLSYYFLFRNKNILFIKSLQ